MNTYLECDRLRLARLASRRSQAELARAVGRSQRWVSKIERGEITADSHQLQRLREILNPDEVLRHV